MAKTNKLQVKYTNTTIKLDKNTKYPKNNTEIILKVHKKWLYILRKLYKSCKTRQTQSSSDLMKWKINKIIHILIISFFVMLM